MMHPSGPGGQEMLPGCADPANGVHDVQAGPAGEGPARTYWENAGPKTWRPVKVRVRYGPLRGDPAVDLPHVTTGRAGPMNVLVERGDGTTDVRPVRLLRVKQPS